MDTHIETNTISDALCLYANCTRIASDLATNWQTHNNTSVGLFACVSIHFLFICFTSDTNTDAHTHTHETRSLVASVSHTENLILRERITWIRSANHHFIRIIITQINDDGQQFLSLSARCSSSGHAHASELK